MSMSERRKKCRCFLDGHKSDCVFGKLERITIAVNHLLATIYKDDRYKTQHEDYLINNCAVAEHVINNERQRSNKSLSVELLEKKCAQLEEAREATLQENSRLKTKADCLNAELFQVKMQYNTVIEGIAADKKTISSFKTQIKQLQNTISNMAEGLW